MASRPLFIPDLTGPPYVEELIVEFTWHAGFSITQKYKSIYSLHESAREMGVEKVLEISTKSPDLLGRELSAFNLNVKFTDMEETKVENIFQGSKEFELGGPFRDLYRVNPKDAKSDERLKSSGELVAFNLRGERWPMNPKTAFYDWIYISALSQNNTLANYLHQFSGFTDIEFNPTKSVNCQARSAALYVSLVRLDLLKSAIANQDSFLSVVAFYPNNGELLQLGFIDE